jgi:multidrug resistance efflux pump
VLARLEDRDLRLQRLEYQSRITEAQRQVTDSVGRRDMAGAAIATARRQQGEAELKLVEENLSRAAITAPFDALVISGDPTQSIGAPLHRGETIYELSPLDGFRVAVDVDEEDLAEMQPGQTGRVLLSSLPYTTWPMTVQRVTPIASARDGHTVFRVEGRLDPSQGPQDASLRPGMQGIVKIDVGPRRYVWIWTHNAIAWARLKIWELVP